MSHRIAATLIAIAALAAAVPQAITQQTPTAEGKLRFEAATIKLAAPDAVRNVVLPTANRMRIPSMTLTWLIYEAYGGGGFNTGMRVTGGPDWVSKRAFAVEGVAPGKATRAQQRLMLQSLLEERFALKIRVENSMGDMLTLVVDRRDGTLGPKVKPWSGTCPTAMPALVFPVPRRPLENGPPSDEDEPNVAGCPSGYRRGGITLDGVTMSTVAEVLSLPPGRGLLGTIVADQTGLKGRYTLELDYTFPPDVTAPSLPTVIQEQWGMRVVPGRGPFRTVVVESAQLPTEN
jgi:uncharacterized protein (TIGR03435 family)